MVGTSLFSRASSFSIRQSSFNVVGRDQITNNIYYRDRKNNEGSEYDELQVSNSFKRKRAATLQSAYENFRTIPIGNMYLIQEVAAMSEIIRVLEDGSKQTMFVARSDAASHGGAVVVTRIVNITTIVNWDTHFTAVIYEGPCAQDAWKRDFDYFSKFKHHTIAQVFGLNRWTVEPILIFYSALSPLSVVLARSSSIALCYLQYRWIVDRGEAFRRLDRAIRDEELWMQDRTGLFCVGPVGPAVRDQRHVLVSEWYQWHKGPLNARLPVSHYDHDLLILEFVDSHHRDLHDFVSHYGVSMVPLAASRDSAYTLCSIYDQSRGESVAHFLPIASSYSIHPWHTQKTTIGMTKFRVTVIDNGWTCVLFTEQIHPGRFHLRYSIRLLQADGVNLRAAWLSQAGYATDAFGCDLSDLVFLDSIHFTVSCSFPTHISLSHPLYLFISPVISETLCTTTTEPLCYWSLDPDGWQEEEVREWPEPVITVSGGSCWRYFQYDAVREYQQHKGFDPYTQAYAKARRYPLLHLNGY